jgi:hypothetical protein
MVTTVLINALSCMLLLAIASILRGQPPSVGFFCKVCASMALVSLALARVLRSHVSEPKTEETTEPVVYPSTATALLNGVQVLTAQK